MKKLDKILIILLILAVIVIVLLMQGCNPADVESRLLSSWQFDEKYGNIAHDSVYGSNGTVYGATWVAGRHGSALLFNGSSYVEIADTKNLRFDTKDFSIEVWAKDLTKSGPILSYYTDDGSIIRGVILVQRTEVPSGVQNEFQLQIIDYNYTTEVNKGESVTTGQFYYTKNKWYHVIAIRNGETLSLYLDGKLINTTGINATANATSLEPLKIGFDPINNWYIAGVIDEIAIYNTALSQEDIHALYLCGKKS